MPEVLAQIEALEKRYRQFQASTLRTTRLTPAQYYILSLLAQQDSRPLKDLAAALACSRATVTGIVDTLEKKGLVQRSPHPSDRRSLLVSLTEAGRQLLALTATLDQTYNCCCEALPADELQALSRLLGKLSAVLPF